MHGEKILDKSTLYSLKPEMNIETVKETLGKAIIEFTEDDPVFKETVCKTNSFIYIFKNANVKITSKDNKKIDTITVFPTDKKFDFENYANHLNLKSYIFNKARVNDSLISESKHTFLAARHDYSFAFKYSLANSFYLQITLFGHFEKDWEIYFKDKNPDIFLNCTINGICISGYNEETYYIYQYELK